MHYSLNNTVLTYVVCMICVLIIYYTSLNVSTMAESEGISLEQRHIIYMFGVKIHLMNSKSTSGDMFFCYYD